MNETTPSLFGITLQNKLTKLRDLELKEREIRRERTAITMEIRLAMANDLGLHVDQVSVTKGQIIINPFRRINHTKVERAEARQPQKVVGKVRIFKVGDGMDDLYRGDEGLDP